MPTLGTLHLESVSGPILLAGLFFMYAFSFGVDRGVLLFVCVDACVRLQATITALS